MISTSLHSGPIEGLISYEYPTLPYFPDQHSWNEALSVIFV